MTGFGEGRSGKELNFCICARTCVFSSCSEPGEDSDGVREVEAASVFPFRSGRSLAR